MFGGVVVPGIILPHARGRHPAKPGVALSYMWRENAWYQLPAEQGRTRVGSGRFAVRLFRIVSPNRAWLEGHRPTSIEAPPTRGWFREALRKECTRHSPTTYASAVPPGFARWDRAHMWKDYTRHLPSSITGCVGRRGCRGWRGCGLGCRSGGPGLQPPAVCGTGRWRVRCRWP